jgi:hypothetical protein
MNEADQRDYVRGQNANLDVCEGCGKLAICVNLECRTTKINGRPTGKFTCRDCQDWLNKTAAQMEAP